MYILFVGCSEGNKSSKEVYIYVLNKDYDATINAEWYSARKTKGGISGIELKNIRGYICGKRLKETPLQLEWRVTNSMWQHPHYPY